MAIAVRKSEGLNLSISRFYFMLINNSWVSDLIRTSISFSFSSKIHSREGGVPGFGSGSFVSSPTSKNPEVLLKSLVDISLTLQKALKCTSFEDVALIIRAYNQTKQESNDFRASSFCSGNFRMSPGEFETYMAEQIFNDCRGKGHWRRNDKCPKYDPNLQILLMLVVLRVMSPKRNQ